MLIVRVFGGLGNQMFQYAFYLYLKNNNDNVFLDTSDFKVHNHHTGYELKRVFNAEYEEARKKDIKRLSVNRNSIFLRTVNKLFGIEIKKSHDCMGRQHFVFIEPKEIKEDVYFDGFWQNVKYLNGNKNELQKVFSFSEELNEKNSSLRSFIEKNECVSVHFRRGDYLDNPKLSSVCDIEYYKKAIEYFESIKNKKFRFIVFSDDSEWVKKSGLLPSDSVYVDWNVGKDSYIDMHLMQLCDHSIIANSTFSWWPAWLKNNDNKIVIMPEKWFLIEDSTRLDIKGAIKI